MVPAVFMSWFSHALPLFLLLVLAAPLARAQQIVLEPVESTALERTGEAKGWQVMDCSDGMTRTTVFRAQKPFSARRVRLTLFFQSEDAGAVFRAFRLLATNDAAPTLDGRWEPMFPVWFGSTEGEMERDEPWLRLKGRADKPIVKVDCSLPFDDVTGVRLEVAATGSGEMPKAARISEMRFQHFNTFTTNAALGCPVTTSHPLLEGMHPGFLTDGLRGTYARPAAADLRDAFFYEIDLKRQQVLDHLHLRTREDALESNRLSQIRVRLYDRKPEAGVSPVWECLYRANGSVPDTGSEIVRPAMGRGTFSGRYLRVSSESCEPFSPQIAEVEAYAVMTPLGVTARAQGRSWKAGATLKIPADASWLSFAIDHPILEDPLGVGRRWRITGFHDQWLVGSASGIVEGRCPPPGSYEFQAQTRHSDQQWNAAIYSVPLVIPTPFWQQTGTRAMLLALTAAVAALIAWKISQRLRTRREVELGRRNELSAERVRIARDMHDAVGSQLTQLTVLHEIMAEEMALPPEARERLRQLTDTARASAAALDAVVWAVNPGNDTLASLAAYLTHSAREYLLPLGITCREDVPHEWPAWQVSSQTRHQLYLAFREALQNVVKHAQATEVTIMLRHAHGLFTASVADDGVGLAADAEGPGKDGLHNMRDRLAAVGGHCEVRARPGGSGTIVELQIPVPT